MTFYTYFAKSLCSLLFIFVGFEPPKMLGENSCFPPNPFSALERVCRASRGVRGFAASGRFALVRGFAASSGTSCRVPSATRKLFLKKKVRETEGFSGTFQKDFFASRECPQNAKTTEFQKDFFRFAAPRSRAANFTASSQKSPSRR